MASGFSLDDIEQIEDQVLEQLFLAKMRRDGLIDDPRYQTLVSLFPEIDKKIKRRENSRENLWKEYQALHPDVYQLTSFKTHYCRWMKLHNSLMHIKHPSGEKMNVDYGGALKAIVTDNLKSAVVRERRARIWRTLL